MDRAATFRRRERSLAQRLPFLVQQNRRMDTTYDDPPRSGAARRLTPRRVAVLFSRAPQRASAEIGSADRWRHRLVAFQSEELGLFGSNGIARKYSY
ncbi:MAG: hypothetical protein HW386_991, partial [Gammaproteobacteria bacterium]|nr:hypothetical protein [Gammaproteobacteria bacterium]